MLFTILLTVISFVFFLLVHIIIFHKKAPKRRFRTMIYIILFLLVLYTCVFYVCMKTGIYNKVNGLVSEYVVILLNGIFVYFFLCFFYFHQIIVFDSSVTTRIMVELEKSDNKRLTLNQLKEKYSLQEKYERELLDMGYMDRIAKEGEFYKNTKKGRQHALIIGYLRNYLNIGGHQ